MKQDVATWLNHWAFAVALLFAATLMGCSSQARSAEDVQPDPFDPAQLPETEQIKLWPSDPPGEPVMDGEVPEMTINNRGSYRFVHEPVLDVYHAKGENRTGAAVVICPGGGYGVLAYAHEGIEVAQWLNRHGITGVILRYRMYPYRHPVPLGDAQRAMQTVRANAEAWGLDRQRIGVLGFSAGGHLASTVTVHHAPADPESDDPPSRYTSRPDFSVLVYPVIAMREPEAHMGSRRNLLGQKPSDEMLDHLSTHLQVNEKTPPTILVHSKDDRAVPIGNSELFRAALKASGITHRMLVYETGGHGYGLGRSRNDPDKTHETDAWPSACIAWFEQIGVVEQAVRP